MSAYSHTFAQEAKSSYINHSRWLIFAPSQMHHDMRKIHAIGILSRLLLSPTYNV